MPSFGRSGSAAPGSGLAGYLADHGVARRALRDRPKIARFHVAHPGHVRIAVWQLAPRCRFVGHFGLHVGSGSNLLRLPRRIGGHRLGVGTYRFVGMSRGRKVLDARFGLVRTKEQRLRVRRHDLVVDACAAGAIFGPGTQGTVGLFTVPGVTPPGQPRPLPQPEPTKSPSASRDFVPAFLPPVLHALNPANASPLARAIFFALLGCAIALLAAGSLPGRAMAAAPGIAFVTRHRMTVTLGGFALLVAAAVLMHVV